ncbi:MAG: hypothetical protein AB1791_12480, partial [Chloroflexota bacterium]
MAAKQPAQATTDKQAQPKRVEAPETATAGLEQVAVTADSSHLSLVGLPPDQPGARPLRQAYVLQMQRRYGNAYVQRLLAGHIQPAAGPTAPLSSPGPPPTLRQAPSTEAAPDETPGGDELAGLGSS